MPVIVCDIGGGNAALDVLACGLAVITGNKCSATEVISAHECGFVRDARDGDGLGAPMTDLSERMVFAA